MDMLALLGRVVLSLAIVLAVMWFAARALRRGQRRTSSGMTLEVLARAPLAQRSSVAVVQVGDRALVLGVTESRVELLSEHPLPDLIRVPAAGSSVDHSSVDNSSVDNSSADDLLARLGATGTSTPTATGLAVAPARGPLAGSLLSPTTWRRTVGAVRDLTVRG